MSATGTLIATLALLTLALLSLQVLGGVFSIDDLTGFEITKLIELPSPWGIVSGGGQQLARAGCIDAAGCCSCMHRLAPCTSAQRRVGACSPAACGQM